MSKLRKLKIASSSCLSDNAYNKFPVLLMVSYNLTLKTYLPSYPDVPENKNLTLEGEVEIMVEVHKAINQIVLHMERLELIEEKCEVLLEPQGDS
ncbi:hypothetical protein OSTOST_24154, partial [Ostertagia ostertagi]